VIKTGGEKIPVAPELENQVPGIPVIIYDELVIQSEIQFQRSIIHAYGDYQQ